MDRKEKKTHLHNDTAGCCTSLALCWRYLVYICVRFMEVRYEIVKGAQNMPGKKKNEVGSPLLTDECRHI